MIRSRLTVPILLAAILTACSGSGSDDGAGASDTAAPTTVTSATAAPAADPTVPEATAAPATTEPPTTTAVPTTTAPEPAEWEPVGDAPYSVGVATVTIDDPDGVRPLTVDVWFPIDDGVDVSTLEPQQYTLLPGTYYESPDALAATVDQIAVAEQYPLIVYSHGSNGLRYIHSSYTEALASHGYLVVATDHTGNTAVDYIAQARAPGDEITLARLSDVRRLIDAFVDPADPVTGEYAAHVDTDRIAVTGHSAGGFTSLATITGYTNDLGEAPADDRVDAIVTLAPAVGAAWFTDERLATIEVPMMTVVGTNDMTTPVDPNVTRLWEFTIGAPAYRVELVDGAHQTFTDLCAYIDFLPTLENVPEIITSTIDDFATEGCSPGDIDAARAAELTNSYVIRFLEQVLRNGPAIDPTAMATPDDVIFYAP
jgi:predicted dienelactone hydrolase